MVTPARPGQAMLKRASLVVGRHCFDIAHLLAEIAIGVMVVIVVAAGGLAMRLAQGPLAVDSVVRPLVASLNRQGPTQLRIGHTLLAWRGWQRSNAPVTLRVQQVELYEIDHGGEVVLARLPDAAVTLSLSRLLIWQLRPRTVTLSGPALHVVRARDGSFAIDLGDLVAPPMSGSPVDELVALGLLGAGADLEKPAAFLSELRHVSIDNARIAITDRELGSDWMVTGASLDFVRDGTTWHGRADLPLAAAGGSSLILAAHADVEANGASRVELSTGTTNPADLARAVPALASLQALRAPLTLDLGATLTPDLVPTAWQFDAAIGPGSIAVADGTLQVAGGKLSLSGHGAITTISALALDVTARHGADVSHFTGSGQFTRDANGVAGTILLDAGTVSFADLPDLWPQGVAPGARAWVTTHLSGGTARGGHLSIGISAQPDFSGLALTSVTGGFEAEDTSLTWLLRVPPITHGRATFSLADRSHIAIQIHSGQQGTIAVGGGSFDITNLGDHPRAALAVNAAGAVPDLLNLIAVPALHLLDRHPLDFTRPSGAFTGHLALSFPLRGQLKAKDFTFDARVQGTDVHLGQLAARHDLDHAALFVTVNDNGLVASGRGEIAEVPGDVATRIDFRPGGIDQIIQHSSFNAFATTAQIAAAGYDPLKLLDQGKVGLAITYNQTRGGSGGAVIDADLTQASLAPQLGWRKQIGSPGHAHGLILVRGRMVSDVPNFTASAPGMTVAGRIAVTEGAISAVSLQRLQLGRSDFAAQVQFPAVPSGAYHVHIKGAAIDLTSELKPDPHATAEDHGPHYVLDASFDHCYLANNQVLDQIAAHAEADGGVIQAAQVSLGAAAAQQTTLTIAPAIDGRLLTVHSGEAGELLLATNTLPDLRGGTLNLVARYDDTKPYHPLTGTATINKFRMSDAPAVTRLLEAMTGYGLIAFAQGPGLAMTTMQTSFTYQHNVLTLKNALAHSASIGFTADGTYNTATSEMNIHGTVVPAYIFNNALSHLPLVGRIFSPEQGGGVLAATFSMRGPHSDPVVRVNPLSALTPGILRGIFGGIT